MAMGCDISQDGINATDGSLGWDEAESSLGPEAVHE